MHWTPSDPGPRPICGSESPRDGPPFWQWDMADDGQFVARADACASDNRIGIASAARRKSHSQFPPDQFTLDAEDDDRTCQNLSSRRALSFVMRAN